MRPSVASRAMMVLAMAALLALAVLHVSRTATDSVRFDDAFIANVAKNVARHNGYSSAFYAIRPFDPEITTGPALILPAAALIGLFGNRYYVPNLAYVLCTWTLLGLVLWTLRRRLMGLQASASVFVIAFGLIVFSTQEFGLLGEIPAALMMALGALALTDPAFPTRRAVLAGLWFGCAVTTKVIALLALPAFVGYLVLRDGERRPRTRRWAGFLGGASLPLGLRELWCVAADGGPIGWIDAKRQDFNIMFGPDSLSGAQTGLAGLASPRVFVETLVRNTGTLASEWGGMLALAAACVATGAAVWRSVRPVEPRSRSVHDAGLVLLLAAVTHLAWWLLLSPTGWTRHLLPGTVYWLMALSSLIAVRPRRSATLAVASASLLIVALVPQFLKVSPPKLRLQPGVRAAALIATADRVREIQQDPDVILIGCGWWHNPDVDFLLPSSASFRDCRAVSEQERVGKRLVLVHSDYFNWEESEQLRRFQESCDRRVLFSRPPFVVAECQGLP